MAIITSKEYPYLLVPNVVSITRTLPGTNFLAHFVISAFAKTMMQFDPFKFKLSCGSAMKNFGLALAIVGVLQCNRSS